MSKKRKCIIFSIVLTICVGLSIVKTFANSTKKEIISDRTFFSKTYSFGNTQKKERVNYSTPVHFKQNNQMIEYDNSFEFTDGVIKNKASNYLLELPFTKNVFMLQYGNNSRIDFKLSNKASLKLLDYDSGKSKESFDEVPNLTGRAIYEYGNDTISFTNCVQSLSIMSTKETIECLSFSISNMTWKKIDNKLMLSNENKLFELHFQGIDNFSKKPIDYEITKSDDSFFVDINGKKSDLVEAVISYKINVDYDYSYFRDKYIDEGYSGYVDDSNLLVGIDPMMSMGPNFVPVHRVHVGIVEITVPYLNINTNTFISSHIHFAKQVITNNSLNNPAITFKQITNKNYNQIDGLTSYSTYMIANGGATQTSYDFDITNEVYSSISGATIVFELTGTPVSGSYSMANFYTANSSNDYPRYNIIYLDCGIAPVYVSISSPTMNCIGYALELMQNISYSYTLTYNQTYQDLIDYIVYVIENYGFNVRVLSSQTASIYSNERRIAFRTFLSINGNSFSETNTHFMMQVKYSPTNNLNDMNVYWAHKLGVNSSLFPLGTDLDQDDVWNFVLQGNNPYNSATTYLAISK